jgi:hypothetical protein
MQAPACSVSLATTLAVRLMNAAVVVFSAATWDGRVLAQKAAVILAIIRVLLLLVMVAVRSVIAAMGIHALNPAALDPMEMVVDFRRHQRLQLL